MASATATAEPEEEPPGMRPRTLSHGLRGVPKFRLRPMPENANSDMLVRPMSIAPAARRRLTAFASVWAAGSSSRAIDPARVISPAMSNAS